MKMNGNTTGSLQKNENGSNSKTSDFCSVSSFSTYPSPDWKNIQNVRNVLSERLKEKIHDVLQAICNYDTKGSGKILPANLYNVLKIFCCPLTLQDFSELIKEIKLDEHGMILYKNFISNLTGVTKQLDAICFNKENEVGADLNMEELEIKIKNKICRNMKNFIRSMWLYDYNNDGMIQKAELKTVLENYCFHLSDNQFNRFWSLYDPRNNGFINYKEFLLKLGSRVESYKRIIPRRIKDKILSSSSFNALYTREEQFEKLCAKLGRDDPAIQGQIFINIINVFKNRVEKNFPTVMRVLEIKDTSGSGYVSQNVFHQVLNYFVMSTSDQLFKQILIYYKISPAASRIPWYTFLKSVCMNSNVAEQSDHSRFLGSVSWNMCKSVIRKLKKNGKTSDNFFNQSFTIPVQSTKVAITRAELRRTINQHLILPISEEEFRALMFILDPSHVNVIQCCDFLSLFDAIEEENGSQILKGQSIERSSPKTYASLSGEKLRREFKKCFNKNFKMILKAIDAFDSEETGAMEINELRNILEKLCFPLSDKQYYEIINCFPQISNNIFYRDFINHYRKTPYEDEEKWKNTVTKLVVHHECPRNKLEFNEILNYIREVVHAHKEEFLKDFKDQDFCNKGIARKEVFSKLVHKYIFRLTDEQFKHLWDILPKNEMGLLMYEDFLKQFDKQCSDRLFIKNLQAPAFVRRSSASSLSSKKSFKSTVSSRTAKERPKTANSTLSSRSISNLSLKSVSSRPKSAVSNRSLERAQSMINLNGNSDLLIQGKGLEKCSILTNEQYKQYRCLDIGAGINSKPSSARTSRSQNEHSLVENGYENEELKIKHSESDQQLISSIKARWRDILRRCKNQDMDHKETISWDEFMNILQKTGISMSDNIKNILEIRYGLKKQYPVNYWIFLRKFLLNFNPNQSHTNLNKKLKRNLVLSGQESVGLCKVLLNHRDKILRNYRDLHHAFRRADKKQTGELSNMEFRKILTFYKISISENDFFYIQDYFDPSLSEKICYDEFLKVFQ